MMAIDSISLFCDEQQDELLFQDDDESDYESTLETINVDSNQALLLDQDLLWDDEELESLFLKEKETFLITPNSHGRKDSVEWILRVNSHYGFSPLTAILAVNYFDRFLATIVTSFQEPWIMQLAAVTCLSLAAKVEETYVPLLLDLQVVETEYMFEAKTIQKWELCVLSSLKWRMNPVTPVSFIDHIIRRLGFKCYAHWEFLHRCETLLLSVISDSRYVCYLPSVLASATMVHVIHQVDQGNGIDYEKELLGILKISKEEVDDCYEFISSTLSKTAERAKSYPQKRKLGEIPDSPNGVTDAMFTSDSSNDSWGMGSSCISSPSTPTHQVFKKSRVKEQKMRLPSLNRVFVE